jgi:threonine/homoserine/homoserine lactone efflux protein
VSRAVLNLIPYALVAAVSPVSLTATLTVMATGRVKALAFAIGFIVGQIGACAIAVSVGFAVVPSSEPRYPTLTAVLELGLGVTLLFLALRVRHRGPVIKPRGAGLRSQRVLERLGRVHLATAFVAGLLLGIGGPKRLVLTLLASASIVAAGGHGSNEKALVLWYSLLSTALVSAAVVAFLGFGDRALEQIAAARRWLSRHQPGLTYYCLLAAGALLVIWGGLGLF